MKMTRREAFQTAAASTCAAMLIEASALAAETNPSTGPAGSMRPLDYGLSFICNTSPMNSVRFWVESRTRIIDTKSGKFTDYYQCASCKSEDTFAPKNLFYKDNYDFMPILGAGRWLVFRRTATPSERYRTTKLTDEMWKEPVLKLRDAPTAVTLESWEQIRDATAAAIPIVTQTEIVNAETGLRAIIECPCKTMNISLEKQLYQVDTGPIALPDLTKTYDPEILCLSPAFIAFNAPDFADFVVEQLTPVTDSVQIYHYSNPISLPATNRVIALGKP